MRVTSTITLLLLLFGVCFCFSEEMGNEDGLISAYEKLQDYPQPGELDSFFGTMVKHSSLIPEYENGFSENALEKGFALLGLERLYKHLRSKELAWRTANSVQQGGAQYRPPYKDLAVRILLIKLFAAVIAKQNDKLTYPQTYYAHVYKGALSDLLYLMTPNPYHGDKVEKANKYLAEIEEECSPEKRYEQEVLLASQSLKIKGNNLLEKLESIKELANAAGANQFKQAVLLYWLLDNTSDDDFLSQPLPTSISIDPNKRLKGIIEEYIKPTVFSEPETLFCKTWGKAHPINRSRGDNLLLVYLGYLLIPSIMAGDTAPRLRELCSEDLFCTFDNQFHFNTRPASLKQPLRKYYEKYHLEKYTCLSTLGMEDFLTPKLISEQRIENCWFVGLASPRGESGSLHVVEDRIIPIYSTTLSQAFNTGLSRMSLFTVVEARKILRLLSHSPEQYNYQLPSESSGVLHNIGLDIEYDYSSAAEGKLIQSGEINQFFRSKITDITGVPTNAARVVYYHFPKAVVKLYTAYKTFDTYYKPGLIIKVEPAHDSTPDKAIAGYAENQFVFSEAATLSQGHSNIPLLLSYEQSRAMKFIDVFASFLGTKTNKFNSEIIVREHKKQECSLYGETYVPSYDIYDNSNSGNRKAHQEYKKKIAEHFQELLKLLDNLPDEPSAQQSEEFWVEACKHCRLIPEFGGNLSYFHNNSLGIHRHSLGALWFFESTSIKSTGFHFWEDWQFPEKMTPKEMFLLLFFLRFIFEGETLSDGNIVNRNAKVGKNSQIDRENQKYSFAYLFMTFLRNMPLWDSDETWMKSYRNLIKRVDELDRKHRITDRILKEIAQAERRLQYKFLNTGEVKDFIEDTSSFDFFETVAHFNWFFSQETRAIFLSHRMKENIPQEMLRKYTFLMQSCLAKDYVRQNAIEFISNKYEQHSRITDLCGRSVMFELAKRIMAGQGKPLLRETYLSMAFNAYSPGVVLQKTISYTTGETQRELKSLYEKTTTRAWKYLQTRIEDNCFEIVKEGELKANLWFPINGCFRAEKCTCPKGEITVIPTIVPISQKTEPYFDEEENYTPKFIAMFPEFIPYSFFDTPQQQQREYRRNYLGVLRHAKSLRAPMTRCTIPEELELDFTYNSLLDDTGLHPDWRETIPGLNKKMTADLSAIEKPQEDMCEFTPILMGKFSRVSWKLLRISNLEGIPFANKRTIAPHLILVLSPGAEDSPTETVEGLLKGSFSNVCHESPCLEFRVKYPHQSKILYDVAVSQFLAQLVPDFESNQQKSAASSKENRKLAQELEKQFGIPLNSMVFWKGIPNPHVKWTEEEKEKPLELFPIELKPE